jgi:hypothetical protein
MTPSIPEWIYRLLDSPFKEGTGKLEVVWKE